MFPPGYLSAGLEGDALDQAGPPLAAGTMGTIDHLIEPGIFLCGALTLVRKPELVERTQARLPNSGEPPFRKLARDF